MKDYLKHLRKHIAPAVGIILIAALWILFAPTKIGGGISYVVVNGNSMEPSFHVGDLILAREQNVYSVDELVVYQHPRIGYVFHRIIDKDFEGAFILKGDNNSWEDTYRPMPEEVVGRLWLHIPKLGKIMQRLRSPFAFAMLILGFIVFALIFVFPKENKKRRRNTRKPITVSASMKTEEKLLFLVLIVVGMFVLGLVAFRRPLFNEVEEPLTYQQEAVYRYTADVPEGVYDSTQVAPGEPIFRKLNGSFSVGMDYIFISEHPASIVGEYRLLAIISDSTGWKRTIELIPPTEFQDNLFTISETLSLDDVQKLIDRFEREAGVERGQYSLSIVADIKIDGVLDGQILQDQFSPTLTFNINDFQVVLAPNLDGGQPSLTPAQSGGLTRTIYETNTLSILGLEIPILTARWIAGALGIPALVTLILLLVQLYRASQQNEWERARLWYGSMFIEARDPHMLGAPQQVELASLDDLANFAEREQRPIFHFPEGDIHHLLIQTPEQNYHYAVNASESSTNIVRREKGNWQLSKDVQNVQVKDAYEHALKGWANAVDKKLSQEGEADRLAELAYELGKRLGVEGTELENIRMAAYLHKIGLMDVPSEILEKKKKLTQKELEILRHHPSYAQQYLDGAELLKPIARAIYYQHERWDGSGHPDGLAGEEIPLGSRIITIVNTWNGLSKTRPYRGAWEVDDICEHLQDQAGKQFDPQAVEAFLELQQMGRLQSAKKGE